jgi:hypothetical protein
MGDVVDGGRRHFHGELLRARTAGENAGGNEGREPGNATVHIISSRFQNAETLIAGAV